MVRNVALLLYIHAFVYLVAEIVAPIEREIRALANSLTSVKDEQEYIVVRERTHRDTAESTNARVKWWSILQAVVLFSVVGWQVYYLKVSFLFGSSVVTSLTRLFRVSLRLNGLFRVIIEFCRFLFAHCTYIIAHLDGLALLPNTISAG